jgi:chitin disaccharide deacetylase
VSAAPRMPPGIIVNADDFGIHPKINAGILSAYHHGIVTSATMLMTTPFVDETVGQVRAESLPVGVHLSLTLGKAVAGRHEVPDLVDERNDFTWSARRLLLCSFAEESEQRLVSQIRREFEAQLQLACDYGVRPTHADSHQHVHMNPAIFSLVEELLPRYGIKRLRYSREVFSISGLAGLLKQGKCSNVAKVALLRWLSRSARPQLATTDGFFGVLYSGAVTKQALRAAILSLQDHHSFEVCIHPGFPASNQETVYPLAYVNEFISDRARQMEHDILVDPDIADLVRQRGLIARSFDGREKPV